MKDIRLSWLALVAGAVALIAAGVGVTYWWLARPGAPPGAAPATAIASAPASTPGPLPEVVIELADEAARRAGISVTPASVSTATGTLRLAGVVEANAYDQVVVAPLVSGRVTQVRVVLGDDVAKGAPLVEIYSPELADAQARFLSIQAEFEAVEKEIARTDRLVAIGAASRQELERIHAEHVRHRTEVESARTRLLLLGMSGPQLARMASSGEVAATTTVVAPIDGVVTARAANPGTTVDPASPLVTLVDLSTVWVVGDVYERDFAAVRVGTPAVVTTTAFPDLRIAGTVAYLDPQVRSETRTAGIRIQVPNPGRRLRLGMYADVEVASAPGVPRLLIPRSAVQNVGERTMVYVRDPGVAGRFIEREVRLGSAAGEQVVVVSGVGAGESVVSAGAFFLRAERERLGLQR
jgi:RND family efflux transporter MFP subunit